MGRINSNTRNGISLVLHEILQRSRASLHDYIRFIELTYEV